MKEHAKIIEGQPLYSLTLTETQARLTAEALEFYMRWCIGQFQAPTSVEFRKTADDYRKANNLDPYPPRDTREILDELRANLFPELRGPGHSYGVGWNEKREQQDAQRAYEIYKEILYEFHKNLEFYTCHSGKPCLHYSDQPVPVFVKLEPEPAAHPVSNS